MPMYTEQRALFEAAAPQKTSHDSVTIGTVVDTNDPQQMGRVRVICQQWGDSWTNVVEDMPWALYVSPFGGQTQVGTRGPGIQGSEGGIAYGMWAIPKVGAQVVVMCIDGDPMNRMYFGCVYDQFTTHTMPHGRYTYEDHPELQKESPVHTPFGPYTSAEKYIEPLATNLRRAFGDRSEPNYEHRTRAADYAVSRVDVSQIDHTYSKVQDDEDVEYDGWTSTQGYQVSRSDPDAPSSHTNRNYDSMVYSITTPGFHAFSMDDRQENCRMRLRTTSGNQILLDDTNERIYISTAHGNNWIELDQDGNIDVFTSNKLSVHSTKEINFTSDDTIRMYAKKGIHMHSDDEIRAYAAKDIHVLTDEKIYAEAKNDINMLTHQKLYVEALNDAHVRTSQKLYVEALNDAHVRTSQKMFVEAVGHVHLRSDDEIRIDAVADIHVQTDANLRVGSVLNTFLQSDQKTHISTGSTLLLKSGEQMHVYSVADMLYTAPRIDLNGPTATQALPADEQAATPPTPATPATPAQYAFWTDRVPDHEPYARVMTKDDFTHEPELPYEDAQVGRLERGRIIARGMYWRR